MLSNGTRAHHIIRPSSPERIMPSKTLFTV
jgi:hypothetical protein